MANVIKKIRIKQQDDTMSDYIPIGAEAKNIDFTNGHSLDQIIGNINPDENGTIEDQLKNIVKYYNNIESLKADISLTVGMHCKILGYDNENDGYFAEYIIINTLPEDIDNEFEVLDNSLIALKISKRTTANYAKNCVYVNNNGTLYSARYNYRDNGVQAIYADIDDYKDAGVEELFFVIKIRIRDLNPGESISLVGGDAFFNDVILAKQYAEAHGIRCNVLRFMGNTKTDYVFNNEEKNKYKELLEYTCNYFQDYFSTIIILNELESLIFASEGGEQFALDCIEICKDYNYKVSISWTNGDKILGMSNTLIEAQDFVSMNLYPIVQFNNDMLVEGNNFECYEWTYETVFNVIESWKKDLWITEFGCQDYYNCLSHPSVSPQNLLSDRKVYTFGETNSWMIDGLYQKYGTKVKKIGQWWDNGFNFYDNAPTEQAKIEGQRKMRKANRKIIMKWRAL